MERMTSFEMADETPRDTAAYLVVVLGGDNYWL